MAENIDLVVWADKSIKDLNRQNFLALNYNLVNLHFQNIW